MPLSNLAVRAVLMVMVALLVFAGSNGTAQGATTWVVTKTDDTDDGVCDGDCSLREAIAAANPVDNVDVPAGVYTLTLGAQLVIDKVLILEGEGVDNTVIEAATEPGVADFRVIYVGAVNAGVSGVTIRHGNVEGGGAGGGIHTLGTLTLRDSAVSGNAASDGGGIYTTRAPSPWQTCWLRPTWRPAMAAAYSKPTAREVTSH